MPWKPAGPCLEPRCPNLAVYRGRCAEHKGIPDKQRQRGSFYQHYGPEWPKIREEVLQAAGIPRERWPLYDIDHDPVYDPDIQPDHRAYKLTPLLHSEHSRKTATQDHNKRYGGSRLTEDYGDHEPRIW